MTGETDQQFATLARDYLDDHGRRHPDFATELGDHRFDAHLPARSAAARSATCNLRNTALT